MDVQILLVDDHRIIREGLRSLVETHQGMAVVGEAQNGRDAIGLAEKLRPHIVVMDVSMPELNGMEATRQIVSKVPGVKVIALSMHSERQFVSKMLEAGASGYLLKECAFEDIAEAIRHVMAGGIYLNPKIAGVVVGEYVERLHKKNASADRLSPREREVLQLIAEGRRTKQIASGLQVSVKTIETHRRNIMEKLGIHTVAGLTKYAIREGITTSDA